MFKTYYSAKPLLDKGSLFNMVLSERSDGKTYDCKYRCFEDYEKNGKTHLYLRRFKTEISPLMYSTFVNDLCRLQPTRTSIYDFRSSKYGVEIKKKTEKTYKDWLVYFAPLSMASKLKSTFDIEKINHIDFDEYVPLDGRYCKDEMELILELWNSIDRERYITTFLALGNKVDLFNPFFNFFELNFDINKRGIRTYKNGQLSVEIYANDEHRQARKNSPFMELIKGTQYEKYMFGETLNDLTIRTTDISNNATPVFSFKTEIGKGTILISDDIMIISNRVNNGLQYIVDKIYDIKYPQVSIKETMANNMLKKFYRYGNIYFEDNKAYNSFEPILRSIK